VPQAAAGAAAGRALREEPAELPRPTQARRGRDRARRTTPVPWHHTHHHDGQNERRAGGGAGCRVRSQVGAIYRIEAPRVRGIYLRASHDQLDVEQRSGGARQVVLC
jgi:hypothetical protein